MFRAVLNVFSIRVRIEGLLGEAESEDLPAGGAAEGGASENV